MPGTPQSSATSQQAVTPLGPEGDAGAVPLPLVRSEKHVVLATAAPSRPRVSSMHTKLDHTKIDTSLYQKVTVQVCGLAA